MDKEREFLAVLEARLDHAIGIFKDTTPEIGNADLKTVVDHARAYEQKRVLQTVHNDFNRIFGEKDGTPGV